VRTIAVKTGRLTAASACTMKLIAELERELAERKAAGLARARRCVESAAGPRVTVEGRELVNFASNDYLGLANHPAVVAAAREGAERWGAGASASHLICGHTRAHAALESALAAWVAPCAEAQALTFSSGYLANLAILTALADRGDAIFADRLNHACLNDGALLSRADFVRYPHADVAHLRSRLASSTARRKLIATDAVFSMDGDVAPLPELLALAAEFDAWLVVDDAHGFGVLGYAENAGRGSLAHYGISSPRIVYMGTLGKAAGVAGAFVAAHPAVIATLVETARSYVFTTAAPPLLACALRASLDVIRNDRGRHLHLASLIAHFRDAVEELRLPLSSSLTAIQPLVVGANDAALALSAALWERGFWVPAIRPPTVPAGTARLRITLTAAHTHDDIDALAAALADFHALNRASS
jgi:8-amino-7-oxononanoate synthase